MVVGKRAVVMLLAMFAGAAAADSVRDLYTSDAIVTGTAEENRQIGFRECLGEVLIKASGDQRILELPALAPLMQRAGSFVASFSYRDRLEGIPIHDEQGTHDRPHDLTCAMSRRPSIRCSILSGASLGSHRALGWPSSLPLKTSSAASCWRATARRAPIWRSRSKLRPYPSPLR